MLLEGVCLVGELVVVREGILLLLGEGTLLLELLLLLGEWALWLELVLLLHERRRGLVERVWVLLLLGLLLLRHLRVGARAATGESKYRLVAAGLSMRPDVEPEPSLVGRVL